jgi:hypothetical protein
MPVDIRRKSAKKDEHLQRSENPDLPKSGRKTVAKGQNGVKIL